MFEWNPQKNAANIGKHGISFEQAVGIFDGPVALARDDRSEYGEERWIGVGAVGREAILAVVYTLRNGRRRIISARPASRREKQAYEEALRKAAGT